MGYTHSKAFFAAIMKYGYDNLIYEELYQIEGDDDEVIAELNKLEVAAIIEHGTLYPNGYNLNAGGDCKNTHPSTREKLRQINLGRVHTPESRAKISQNNARIWLGKPRSNEMKKAVSKKLMGHPVSAETRAKQSLARIGKEPWNKGKTGTKTPEQLAKQAEIGRRSLHNRWHVDRGIVNPECSLC